MQEYIKFKDEKGYLPLAFSQKYLFQGCIDPASEMSGSIEAQMNKENARFAEQKTHERGVNLLQETQQFFSLHNKSENLEEARKRSLQDQGGVDSMAMIQQGIELANDRLQAVLEPPRMHTEKDGDCLFKTVLQGLGKDVDEKSVQRSRTECAQYGAQKMQNQELDLSHIANPERELANLERQGEWAGDIGDYVPQLLSSSMGVPIVILELETNTIQYVLPENLLNESSNTAPIAIVRNRNHYEAINIPASQAPIIQYAVDSERRTRQEELRQESLRIENATAEREKRGISLG